MEKHEQLLIALRKIIRATDLYSKQLNKVAGLTAPQLLLLREIAAAPEGVTASTVAQNIKLSPATVSNIIDRLEHRQLLKRTRSTTDTRRVSLALTESAQELLAKAPKPLQHHFIELFASLQDWEQSALLSAMERIAYMM